MKRIPALVREIKGTTVIEFGLVATLVLVTTITALNALDEDFDTNLNTFADEPLLFYGIDLVQLNGDHRPPASPVARHEADPLIPGD
jgi:Flp pilus assembly pilin Flp